MRLITGGHLHVANLTLADWARCVELIETYADLGLGLVDDLRRRYRGTPEPHHHRDAQPAGLQRRAPAHTEAFDLIP